LCISNFDSFIAVLSGFMAFRIISLSALPTFDIMSISAVSKAQSRINQKS
jgi:hypothetical protein